MAADIIYYRFFGDVMSVPALFAVGQTPRVVATIRSLFTARLLWLFVDLPFAAWLVVRIRGTWAFDREPPRRPWRLALATVAAFGAVGFALSAPAALAAMPLDQMFRNRTVMEQLGPYGFHAYDAWMYVRATAFRPPLTKKEVDALAYWFADRAPLRAGNGSAYFGAALKKNLIVVQVESLQDFVVDYRVGGKTSCRTCASGATTVFASRMSRIRPTKAGRRTRSSRRWCRCCRWTTARCRSATRRTRTSAFRACWRSTATARCRPWPSSRASGTAGVMHPLYGFSRSYYESDFTMTEQIGWGLNDHDFLQQMVPRLESQRRPFCAWLITLSLHHPFESFPDQHKTLTLGALEGTSFGNYLHTMRLFRSGARGLQNIARAIRPA